MTETEAITTPYRTAHDMREILQRMQRFEANLRRPVATLGDDKSLRDRVRPLLTDWGEVAYAIRDHVLEMEAEGVFEPGKKRGRPRKDDAKHAPSRTTDDAAAAESNVTAAHDLTEN